MKTTHPPPSERWIDQEISPLGVYSLLNDCLAGNSGVLCRAAQVRRGPCWWHEQHALCESRFSPEHDNPNHMWLDRSHRGVLLRSSGFRPVLAVSTSWRNLPRGPVFYPRIDQKCADALRREHRYAHVPRCTRQWTDHLKNQPGRMGRPAYLADKGHQVSRSSTWTTTSHVSAQSRLKPRTCVSFRGSSASSLVEFNLHWRQRCTLSRTLEETLIFILCYCVAPLQNLLWNWSGTSDGLLAVLQRAERFNSIVQFPSPQPE